MGAAMFVWAALRVGLKQDFKVMIYRGVTAAPPSSALLDISSFLGFYFCLEYH